MFLRIFILIIFVLQTIGVNAQNQGAIWYFGSNAGLDFNTNPPTILNNGQINTQEGCAVMCDAAGNLLFYTDGITVWDKNHTIMPSQPASLGGDPSSTQSAIIVPKPSSPNIYYIFSTPAVGSGAFQYAEVDMSLNAGNGDLTTWNNILHNPTSEKLTAIGNCNGTEFWVMSHPFNSDTFYAYKINAAGIQPPVKTKIGSVPSNCLGLGYIHFSPDGTKFVSANYSGVDNFELYDFNATTGVLSNMISDPIPDGYGSCFSPDGSKLYISSASSIFQYDLSLGSTAAILASKTIIGNSSYGALQYAINGKMYHSNFTNAIDVIEFPNLAGAACNLITGGQSIAPNTGAFGLTAILENYLGGASNLKLRYNGCNGLDSTNFVSAFNSPGATYLWNFGDPSTGANDTSTLASPIHIFSTADTFSVSLIVNSLCGSDTIFRNIIIDTLPKVTISIQDTTYCKPGIGIVAYADAGQNGGTFSWSPATNISCTGCDTVMLSPQTSTNYVVTYTSAGSCVAKDTIQLNIIPFPTLTLNLGNDSVCKGQAINAQLIGANLSLSWQWHFGDGTISNGNANTFHTYQNAGTYTIYAYVSDTLTCKDTLSAQVYIDNPYVAYFDISDDSICIGEPVILIDTLGNNVNYTYDFGDLIQLNNVTSPIHTYQNSGTFNIQQSIDNVICPNSVFTRPVQVFAYPNVNLGPDTSICPGISPPYNLVNNSGTSMLWSNGSTGNNLTVVDAGVYFVTAYNQNCATTDTIQVFRDCYLNIPNAFTPDNDNLNGYFLPRELLSSGVVKFDMNIYNRWGERVFTTNSLNGRGWDGKFGNKPQPMGVYVYNIRVAFNNGEVKNYTGNVTLIR